MVFNSQRVRVICRALLDVLFDPPVLLITVGLLAFVAYGALIGDAAMFAVAACVLLALVVTLVFAVLITETAAQNDDDDPQHPVPA